MNDFINPIALRKAKISKYNRVNVLPTSLTLLHSERPKLYTVLAFPTSLALLHSECNRVNVVPKFYTRYAALFLTFSEGIVKFLLDTEADPRIRNRKRQTPSNLAQNSVIKRELQLAFENLPPIIVTHKEVSQMSTQVLHSLCAMAELQICG